MKNVYLTIDDSPSEKMGDLLVLLKQYKVPAVFFCIGKNLERFPQLAIDAIQAGFVLGNHSWSHPHFSKITIEQAFLEIQKTDALLDTLYEKAGVVRPAKWFRFPYGDKGDGRKGLIFKPMQAKGALRGQIIQTLLRGLNYDLPAFDGISYAYYQNQLAKDVDWHWTFDVMEWATSMRRPTFGLKDWTSIKSRLDTSNPLDCRGESGATNRWLASSSDEIILLHDHLETTHLLPQILDNLSQKKLRFQRFEELH